MGSKRKHQQTGYSKPRKRPRKELTADRPSTLSRPVQQPTLRCYYNHVSSLRQYLLSKLPSSTSKARIRRLCEVEKCRAEVIVPPHAQHKKKAELTLNGDHDTLRAFLDSTLVCYETTSSEIEDGTLATDFAAFSQQSLSSTGNSLEEGTVLQSEIIDFAIWRLFYKRYPKTYRPPHLLCYGYQRASPPCNAGEDHFALASIPGVTSRFPNTYVTQLKSTVWKELFRLLGKEGDIIMLDLVLDSALFAPVNAGKGNFYQLSGVPLTELEPIREQSLLKDLTAPQLSKTIEPTLSPSTKHTAVRSLGAIHIVRNRMFYARAALNASGRVTFGLRHIHVLNRYRDPGDRKQTLHVMKYIFPRQFGLHNVFTSGADPHETIQPFKDYTLREQEISQAGPHAMSRTQSNSPQTVDEASRIPKRLRGTPMALVKKLQILHARCSYDQLLQHHCPITGQDTRENSLRTQDSHNTKLSQHAAKIRGLATRHAMLSHNHALGDTLKGDFTVFATSPSDVSLFCRATLSKIIPNGFWGHSKDRTANKKLIMERIDRFVHLRKFETLSLHNIAQGIKMKAIMWLKPPHSDESNKVSASDMQKRQEILFEFLYYVFDSLLVPLIRCNFHVTESSNHRNRLFYFRHDVWRAMAEPSLAELRNTMLQEIPTVKALEILDARTLGFSQVRLLPKSKGVRPIINLRRRVNKIKNGKPVLGRSINSTILPIFRILEYAKKADSTSTGSALLSVGDMYMKLKSFQHRLSRDNGSKTRLFFAKCDVQACFDTLPQRRSILIAKQLMQEDEYNVHRHAEVRVLRGLQTIADIRRPARCGRKFVSTAQAVTEFQDFGQIVAKTIATDRKDTVFVDGISHFRHQRGKLLALLEDHVENNMLKVGKKFYRQKSGIPQGSVLSNLLCNLVYARMELENFDFLRSEESILLRLVDDFLLITTNERHARLFLRIMHMGIEEYGVHVNPDKSITNFEMFIDGRQIPLAQQRFPYCGSLIDTRSLEITKDRQRRRDTLLSDSLTVDLSRTPGQKFYTKALNAFKIQTHRMFCDTNYNSLNTVLCTVYQHLLETAMKVYRYGRCMSAIKAPSANLLIRTIQDLIDLAYVLVKAINKASNLEEYQCAVDKHQICWLASKAFHSVLGRKQTRFAQVIRWLELRTKASAPKGKREALRLTQAVDRGNMEFHTYKY